MSQLVLITGTSSGLGKVMAISLANSGYRVVAAMRGVTGKNASVAQELRSLSTPTPIQVVDIDVNDDASVDRGVNEVMKTNGHIDVLINCAGIMWTGFAEAFSANQLQGILNTNLVGPFRMLKAVLPAMRKRQQGLCITVTSLAGRTFAPGMGIYAASKSGMEALAEVMGYELSTQNIDTVIIEPGMFQTNLMAGQQEPDNQAINAAYAENFPGFQLVQENVQKALMEAGLENCDPQRVAERIQEVIETPPGQRPIRVTVGLDFNTDALNKAAAVEQRKFLDMLGFSDSLRVKPK
jgi:NAD(P)-dependent dehydrogenase (short-subunit alcohol dehydrogenase family)